MKRYIISDLHIGGGGPSDDFSRNRETLEAFLEYVEKEGSRLIVAGDLIELWQFSVWHILERYGGLLQRLLGLADIFTIGNHDIELQLLLGLGEPFVSRIVERYHVPDTDVLVLHGHQFDTYNDPARNLSIGRLVTAVVGKMERVYADADEFLSALQGDAAARARVSAAIGGELGGDLGGEPVDAVEILTAHLKDTYLGKAIQLVDDAPSVVRLICGHTHKPGRTRDGRIINAGHWTGSEPTYVEVDTANPYEEQVVLRRWPSRDVYDGPPLGE